jgi:hypothetical protein
MAAGHVTPLFKKTFANGSWHFPESHHKHNPALNAVENSFVCLAAKPQALFLQAVLQWSCAFP